MKLKDILGIKKDLKKAYVDINDDQSQLASKVGEIINHSSSHSVSNRHSQAVRNMYNRQLKQYDKLLFAQVLNVDCLEATKDELVGIRFELDTLPAELIGIGVLINFGGVITEQYSNVSQSQVSDIMVMFTKLPSGHWCMQLIKKVFAQGWQATLYNITLEGGFLESYLNGYNLEPEVNLVIDNQALIPTDEHMVFELDRAMKGLAMVLRDYANGKPVNKFKIKLDQPRTLNIMI